MVPLRLPPLRERTEDIPDLVRHFLSRSRPENRNVKNMEPDAIDILVRYNWPGNIKELENLVKRLDALYGHDDISVKRKPGCFAYCRKANIQVSAAGLRSRPMCASSPPPTAIFKTIFPRGSFAKISITG